MLCRFQTAALVAPLALASTACVHPRLPPPDPAASLRVRVTLQGNEDANLRTFVARSIRIAPRPALSSTWMPLVSRGGGAVAFASERGDRSLLWVLNEDSFMGRPVISLIQVSYPQEGDAGLRIDYPASVGVESSPTKPSPPCDWWSAFFVKGVGDRPRGPVILHRYQDDDGPSRSIAIDPVRHTVVLRPVLRFSTRDVRDLRNRKATFLLGVTLTAGRKPFVLLGLLRRPDGSYSEAAFVSKAEEQGWGAFVHTPEETTDISFYALDDPPAFHSVCRAQLSSREEPER